MDLPFQPGQRRRVYLMRHGDVAYFGADGKPVSDSRLVVLTEKGRAEAAAMRALLAEAPIDRAICSGLPRTVETAELVLGDRTLPLERRAALEEIRGGDPIARARLAPPDYAYAMFRAADPGACYANGESFRSFYDRVVPAYLGIIEELNWTHLLLVAHGGVNRALLCHITGAGLGAFGAFEQDTCCLNVIDVDADAQTGAVLRTVIRGLNITPEDPGKLTRQLLTMERQVQKAVAAGAIKPA